MIQEGRCINARKLRAQCTPRRQSRQATMHCIHTFGTLRRHELGHIRKNRRNVMIEEKGKRTPTITIANGGPTVGTLDIFPTKDAHRPRKNAFKAQTTAHLRKTPSNVGRTQCSVIVRIHHSILLTCEGDTYKVWRLLSFPMLIGIVPFNPRLLERRLTY